MLCNSSREILRQIRGHGGSAGLALLLFVLLISRAGCALLVNPACTGRITGREGEELVATIQQDDETGVSPGRSVRFMRTEFVGNPRSGRRQWVTRGTGVITAVDASTLHIKIEEGYAGPGDRVVCSGIRQDSIEHIQDDHAGHQSKQ